MIKVILIIIGVIGLNFCDKNFYSGNKFIGTMTAHASGMVENLDEIALRKMRLTAAPWGYSLLQDDGNNYIWQSETLNYADITTNNEVWRFTYAPESQNNTQDIAFTHWSANGKRVMFHSRRATNAFTYANGSNVIWMLSDTDGAGLRPAKNSPAHLTSMHHYIAWSPILEDVFYSGFSNDGQGLLPYVLYKGVVSDTTISRSSFLTLPDTVSGIGVKKGISADGRKMFVSDLNSNVSFPLTVYPETLKLVDDDNGYVNIFNFDLFWGNTTTWNNAYHDQYLTGAINGIDSVWNYLMPETITADGPLWRTRLSGSASDGGPFHISDQIAPFNWGGEIEPVNTVTDHVNSPSPWCGDGSITPNGTQCMDAPGHVSPDKWGHYLVASKGNNCSTYGGCGISFYNTRTHAYEKIFTEYQPSHPDWEAWSDWSTASAGVTQNEPVSGPTASQKIVTVNINAADSLKVLASSHPRYNQVGEPDYEANARPTQSPDGTKVLFNSTFLNASDNYPQLYWIVAYYPYPPEIKSAVKNDSSIRLRWDFNQGQNCSNDAGITDRAGSTPNLINPRTYATRGWPHETLDCPPSPREIKNFRVWQSTDNSTWIPIGITTYSNCSGNNECGMWSETSWNFDATQSNNTTKYYAVTSLEHSGLESKTLSNVWKVTIDANGDIAEQIQQTTYPSDPGGKSNFFAESPDSPILISANHKQSPATVDGQYTLSWSAPINHDLIRYYNIYAHDDSEPSTIQQMRIASIPATSDYNSDNNFSYVDWLGNPDGSTQYKITAVDFQGNESGVIISSDPAAPASPHELSVM